MSQSALLLVAEGPPEAGTSSQVEDLSASQENVHKELLIRLETITAVTGDVLGGSGRKSLFSPARCCKVVFT